MDVRAKMNVKEGNGGTGESVSFDLLDIRSGDEGLNVHRWALAEQDRDLLWIDSVIDVGFRRNLLTVYKKSDSLGTAKLIRSHYENKPLEANLSVGVMEGDAFTQKVAYEFGFVVKSIRDNQGVRLNTIV